MIPMTARQFVLRGLRHYRSGYLGVLLGSALGAMVLLGALFSGDSVKSTLATIAQQRVGQVGEVLVGGENLFRSALGEELDAAAVLQLRGQAGAADGRSTGQVDLLGVDDRFWGFAPRPMDAPDLDPRRWAINRTLAAELDLATGDALILRLRKPGLVSADAPLSGDTDEPVVLRGEVGRILGDDEMGRFHLAASQLPSPAVFLPLDRLASAIERPERANLLLLPAGTASLREQLRPALRLADYGLSLRDVPGSGAAELRSERVFLAPAIEDKVRAAFPAAEPVLTYFVNTLAANQRETPYSMVTGVAPESVDFLPDDLAPDEIVLNAWQAEDLGAATGDRVTLRYYLLRNGRLVEEEAAFTVRAIVPLEDAAADPGWMPEFPGIAEAESSSDWTPGMPLDLDRIRDKDEEYWDRHRGTPKAFLRYERARELWHNRWGEVTALRLPTGTPGVEERLLATLEPADGGLLLRDVGSEAARAARSPTDIAGLFLSMSFFLILAAVGLTAMLFRFNVEQRNRETGLLAAIGIPTGKILHWRLAEGLVVVTLGCALGLLLALAYTFGLLRFLETIWGGEAGRLFTFHAAPASILGGTLGMIALVMSAIWLATRRQAKRSASLRLEASTEEVRRGGTPWARWIAPAAALAGIAALFSSAALGAQGAFFLAGFAFLVAGLAAYRAVLARFRPGTAPNLSALAKLNAARRPTRSLVVVGSLAAGVFLVLAVAAFRKHGGDGWRNPRSGAGGFAFWIETSSPLERDSNGGFPLGVDSLGPVVGGRLGTGDDASCFNLNSVARPRLIATDPTQLAGRFTIKNTVAGVEPAWHALSGGDTLRAFVDETTLLWAIKRKLGDRLRYLDEAGREFEVEIVGTLADSIFQGNLVVDESRFLERYPSAGGYRLLLAESPDPQAALPELQRSLRDLGASVTPTRERLDAFHGVENTYIAIFQVLGGLGVVLGSAGLGLLTARNLQERREEFATLHTLGIPRAAIRGLVIRETRRAIGWALAIGLVAAVVSILPTLPDQSLAATLGTMALFVVLILAATALSAWLAIRGGLPGNFSPSS